MKTLPLFVLLLFSRFAGGQAYTEFQIHPNGLIDSQREQQRFEQATEDYYGKYQIWDSLRIRYIEEELVPSGRLRPVLEVAVEAALAGGGYDETLEEYAGRFLSKEKMLELMRRRRVVGSCSQDERPREHAVATAQL